MISQRCIDCGKGVEWKILGINLGVFILKGWFALASQSKALFADTLQSLTNFVITIVILASLKIASRGPDEEFPYGYGKIEFLASGIANVMLLIAAAVCTVISLRELIIFKPEQPPKLIAVAAAVISIIANQIAFGYGRCAGEKLGSTAMLANARVNRADVGTSMAVIIAVVGANLGFFMLDHIVAIVICVLIVKMTLDGAREAIKGLMDVSVRSEEQHIRNLMKDVEGIEGVEDVKARLVGRRLRVDLNILVPAEWILSRGLETVQKIKKVLRAKMENVSEVSVQLLPFAGGDDRGSKNVIRSGNAEER